MAGITVTVPPDVLEAAARAAGVYHPDVPPARLARDLIYATAGRTAPRLAGSNGGAAPKRAGREWENAVVDHANGRGFNWDRAPLRGARDLLDVTGCLPGGWLIGAKSLTTGARMDQRASEAMQQAHRALENLAERGLGGLPRSSTVQVLDDVIPWQIMQRRGHPVGQAYAITEYDWMLRICELRRDAEKLARGKRK